MFFCGREEQSSDSKGFSNGNVTYLRGKLPWQSRAKEYHKYTTQQTAHKRFIGREEKYPLSRSRELNRRQALCRISWGSDELSREGIGGISSSEVGLFTLYGGT